MCTGFTWNLLCCWRRFRRISPGFCRFIKTSWPLSWYLSAWLKELTITWLSNLSGDCQCVLFSVYSLKKYVLRRAEHAYVVKFQTIGDCPLSIWKIDVVGWKMAVFLNIACRKWTFLAGFSALPSSQMALCTIFWLLMLTLFIDWKNSQSFFVVVSSAILYITQCAVHIIERWMNREVESTYRCPGVSHHQGVCGRVPSKTWLSGDENHNNKQPWQPLTSLSAHVKKNPACQRSVCICHVLAVSLSHDVIAF